MRALLAVIMLLAFSIGASSAQGQIKTSTSFDQYSKATTVVTDRVEVEGASTGFLDVSSAFAWLSGVVEKDDAEVLGMRVYFMSGSGWAFFESAVDLDGIALKVTPINRQVGGVSLVQEEFHVHMPRDYLERHRSDGVNLKAYGKSRNMVIKLPGAAVQAFLDALVPVREMSRLLADAAGVPAPLAKVRLGVKYVPVTPSIAKSTGQEQAMGVILVDVVADSVAAACGLRQGDVVLSIDGRTVEPKMHGLVERLVGIEPGQVAMAHVRREGKEMQVPLRF